MFFNGDVAATAGLVVKIDELVKSYDAAGLKGLIVYIAEPAKKSAKLAAIKQIAAKCAVGVPMVLLSDSDKALDDYRINTSAGNTILVNRDNKVFSNIVNGSVDAFATVSDAVKKMLQ